MHSNKEKSTQFFEINKLTPAQKEWTIKALVLRKGAIETYSGRTGNGQLWKIVLMDKEGTKIQATMFNHAVDKFKNFFDKDKTYVISNGVVKSIKTTFINVNNKIELSLTHFTVVKESTEDISKEVVDYCFSSFDEVQDRVEGSQLFDIVGVVLHVKASINIFREKRPIKKREVLIVDSKFERLQLILWGDLAENEGGFIEDNVENHPILALSKCKASFYDDNLQVSTTAATTVEINPIIHGMNRLKVSFDNFMDGKEPSSFLSNGKRISRAKEITLKQIIENTNQEMECCFKATIMTIENKDEPWYHSCNNCNKKVFCVEDRATCFNCNESDVVFNTRFFLKFNISDGDEQAFVTIFDKSEILIGCSPKKYIKSVAEVPKEQSVFYRKLVLCQGKEYRFLVKSNKVTDIDRRQILVEEMEEVKSKNKAILVDVDEDQGQYFKVKKVKVEKE